MRIFLHALVIATALGTQVPAHAATPPATSGGSTDTQARAAPQRRLFDAIDTDHDGVVSREEYRRWVDQRFQKLDRNTDGRVDANEIADSAAARERRQRRAERFVARVDSSGSGRISQADFEAKAMQRFDRLAGGADGITPEQLAGRRGRHARDGGARPQN